MSLGILMLHLILYHQFIQFSIIQLLKHQRLLDIHILEFNILLHVACLEVLHDCLLLWLEGVDLLLEGWGLQLIATLCWVSARGHGALELYFVLVSHLVAIGILLDLISLWVYDPIHTFSEVFAEQLGGLPVGTLQVRIVGHRLHVDAIGVQGLVRNYMALATVEFAVSAAALELFVPYLLLLQ
jgi:hypothetical protein